MDDVSSKSNNDNTIGSDPKLVNKSPHIAVVPERDSKFEIKDPNVNNPAKSTINNPSRSSARVDRVRAAKVALLVLVCAGAGMGGGFIANREANRSTYDNSIIPEATQQSAKQDSELISSIVKKVSPSVVSVNVFSDSRSSLFGGVDQSSGAGTGIIISEDGYILTNRHVVPEDTTTVSVTLSDGTEIKDVEVIGRTGANDPLDVAFLKIGDAKGKKLVKATIGDSSKVEIGDKVVAIGNALGQFQNTVTDGIISGYGRDLDAGDENGGSVETLQNLFQTDAAINPGNSGGPLLNIDGEVIGINTAIAGGIAQNIGFAIPSNDVSGLLNNVLKSGKLERPYLGVRYVALTDDFAYQYNLQIKRGAYILPAERGLASIIPDSPAAKAGLKEKDIITKIDGTSIDERNSLISIVSRKAVGSEIELVVVRDGKEQTLKVKLQAAPSN
ncbi:trypsin-like peptidase domain-containing protein [Candidatus Saccharibacteria bacterium]|nr:trypsin-like peptidase domain-containing protein [Candidatus Saccharibacteria bacterium]